MYVCMYVFFVCKFVRMYVRISECIQVCVYVFFVRTLKMMYVCMYVLQYLPTVLRQSRPTLPLRMCD